jgi:hypothetical protein
MSKVTRRGLYLFLTAVLTATLATGTNALGSTGSAGILGAGQTGPRSAVPWRQVGPGWVLAEYWPGRPVWEFKPRAARATLYLIDPAGGRYRLYQWRATKTPPYLVDWSGDKKRALLSLSPTSSQLEQVVLPTGQTTEFRLPGDAQALAYTRPTGQAVLGYRGMSAPELARYRLTGQLAQVLVRKAVGLSAVYSPSGTVLAAGGQDGILLVSSRNGAVRSLPVPGVRGTCAPSRWWSPRVILAFCQVKGTSGTRLWLVPASGARPLALTAQPAVHGAEAIGAWLVGGQLYGQSFLASGDAQVFRQAPGGQPVTVTVPGTPGSNWILAARRASLLLAAEQSPCADESTSLLWFSPATGHEQNLLKPPRGLAGVIGGVPYGQPLAPFVYAVGCVGTGGAAAIGSAARGRGAGPSQDFDASR